MAAVTSRPRPRPALPVTRPARLSLRLQRRREEPRRECGDVSGRGRGPRGSVGAPPAAQAPAARGSPRPLQSAGVARGWLRVHSPKVSSGACFMSCVTRPSSCCVRGGNRGWERLANPVRAAEPCSLGPGLRVASRRPPYLCDDPLKSGWFLFLCVLVFMKATGPLFCLWT